MSQRLVVMLRKIQPLAGRCPSCGLPLDARRCRILSRERLKAAARKRTGFAEIINVLCNGTPTLPTMPCPCATHPHAARCPQ